MIERRFFVDPGALDAAAMSASVRDEEHHHLSRVLRLRPGDEVSVFDGMGRGYQGVVAEIARHETRVTLTAPDRRPVEPSFRLTLAQGIPHHEKMELIVQKTTEIGAAALVPIVAERTVPRPGRDGRWTRLERWRRVARDAARQSGRLSVPAIAEPIAWSDFLAGLPSGPAESRLLLDPDGDTREEAGRLALPSGAGSALLAVGPEGGWTPREIEMARARGFAQVGLGPRILRAETAGIAASALVLFLAGEMGCGRMSGL